MYRYVFSSVFFAVAFGGQSVGMFSSFIPDIIKAKLAGALVFSIIEWEPLIDSSAVGGEKPVRASTLADIHT